MFLTQDDYGKILTALENNLYVNGGGKRCVSIDARRSDDGSARSSIDPNPSSRGNEMTLHDPHIWDVVRAHAAEMITWPINNPPATAPPPYHIPNVHAYPEMPDKGKGKGTRTLHREPWNRRGRGVYRGDAVAPRSRTASPASSAHPSMPDIDLTGNGEELIEV